MKPVSIVAAMFACLGIGVFAGRTFLTPKTMPLDQKSPEVRQLKHDAIEAAANRDHFKACALYKDAILKGVQFGPAETNILEVACSSTRWLAS